MTPRDHRMTDVTRGREAGSAYIIALMALFLLTILGISLSLVTQTEVLAGSQERTIERTFYAAESGLEVSIAQALGEGNFGPVQHKTQRASVEQGALMQVEEDVQSSPFFCMGDAPCNFCSINQGSTWVKRNHMLASNATRQAVIDASNQVAVGRKQITEMVDVEPMQTILDCLADLPQNTDTFQFDEY